MTQKCPRPLGSLGIFLLALVVPGYLFASDFEAGLEAIQKGNFAEAYCLWKPLAASGHADAQYRIGWMYANGDGLAINIAEAIRWWERAAERSHSEAQFALGLAYTTGEGIKKDLSTATEWFRKAASNGHEEAQYILRKMAADEVPEVDTAFFDLLKNDWHTLGKSVQIKVNTANVRKVPGLKSKVIAVLGEGHELIELKARKNWVQVGITGLGLRGWIHRSLVE